jgi:pyruvate,water dikinase
MTYAIALDAVKPEDRDLVGGKAYTLSLLARHGMSIPGGLAVTVHAYRTHVEATGLAERIPMELGRKRFEEMRWEEMWDAALRIRSLFLRSAMPADLEAALREALADRFEERAAVVRSSAPGEDATATSFAGLHESYVNVRGTAAVLEAVRRVWASLWSDAALLYRRELGLDVETSAMAVLIQEIVPGERSGVAFCRNPNDPSQAVIEAVHGLNEGLVDGRVEPDRWLLDRVSGRLVSHTPPTRNSAIFPADEGTRLRPLSAEARTRPPLEPREVDRVYRLAMSAESLLGSPQDVEWTFRGERLYTLQARPITTLEEGGDEDRRPWYLSLRRSLRDLLALRGRIEKEILPGMAEEAARLDAVDPARLEDADLSGEIRRRKDVLDQWTGVYWDECIPFAHGVRLFGHVYNDTLQPEDPFEFVGLLGSGDLLSVARNRALDGLASVVREDRGLTAALRRGERSELPDTFERALDDYLDRFGELSCHEASCTRDRDDLLLLVSKLAALPPRERPEKETNREQLEKRFLSAFSADRRQEAVRLLDLARASYRLRDDDNLYLGRIEARLLRAAEEGKARLRARLGDGVDGLDPLEVAEALEQPSFRVPQRKKVHSQDLAEIPRQLTGQPAGPGVASGRARVVHRPEDLRSLEAGEILVCDAVDPGMTAVVPLAAAIVERRGGMLIHGAIIAREYGLPCVTGVPDATVRLRTGDRITVDGFLGIVTVDRALDGEPV